MLWTLTVALLGLGVTNGPAIWQWLTVRRIQIDEKSGRHRVLGFYSVKRFRNPPVRHGITLAHYLDTGFKSVESEWKDGITFSSTSWNLDGTVHEQLRENSLPGRRVPLLGKSSPPWWWNVTDQTEPTAPWWDHEKNRAKD